MIRISLLCLGFLAIGPLTLAASTGSPEERAAYEIARDDAGRDAEAHVRLALWCEDRGMESERLRHLSRAVMFDPNHTTARALLGQIASSGRWITPDRIEIDPEIREKRREYEERRPRADQTADSQWRLALWCEQNGLEAESRAHLHVVTRLDPKREGAWKRLGYKKHNNRWMTPEQIEAEQVEIAAQAEADQHWKPLLRQLRSDLEQASTRAEAERKLAEVDDPRAVPVVWEVFASRDATDQSIAVQLLGQIDSPDASRSLAFLAVYSESAEVRRIATETLRHRDPRSFADRLIRLIREPIKYEVRRVGGPGSPGQLFVEGKRFNLKRLYVAPLPQIPPMIPGDRMVYDPDGLPVLERSFMHSSIGIQSLGMSTLFAHALAAPDPSREQALIERLQQSPLGPEQGRIAGETLIRAEKNSRVPVTRIGDGSVGLPIFYASRTFEIPIGQILQEAHRAAGTAQEQLQTDIAAIEAYNTPIKELNDRVVPLLEEVTGQRYGAVPQDWQAWWIDQIGFRNIPPRQTARTPTYQDVVAVQPRPVPIGVFDTPIAVTRIVSCFGAGTLVHTLGDGKRPIEEIKVGDLVLAQDAETGSLGYQPVVAVQHNPPSKTFNVRLNDETIVSSEFHRFWVAGRGWVMARDLAPGETIRTLGRLARIESIEDGEVQPVFNLEVADSRSFFVGEQGVLVHDNTLPSPVLEPFDAVPVLAAIETPEPQD